MHYNGQVVTHSSGSPVDCTCYINGVVCDIWVKFKSEASIIRRSVNTADPLNIELQQRYILAIYTLIIRIRLLFKTYNKQHGAYIKYNWSKSQWISIWTCLNTGACTVLATVQSGVQDLVSTSGPKGSTGPLLVHPYFPFFPVQFITRAAVSLIEITPAITYYHTYSQARNHSHPWQTSTQIHLHSTSKFFLNWKRPIKAFLLIIEKGMDMPLFVQM